jgi:hypothetical protein
MFALAIGVGQATTRLELSQVHLLAGYTLLAVVASFFMDRYSGFALAAFGLVIGLHLIGVIGRLPKIIAGEVLLVAGMLFCGFNGPSGGIFDRRADASDHRHDTSVSAVARSAQEDTALSK